MMRGPSRRRRQRQTDTPYAGRSNRFSTAGWLFIGLILGLIGGLTYSWVLSPVVYVDASPAQFSPEFKAIYIEQVSRGYIATGDWNTAESRLAALQDSAINETVAELLDEAIRTQKPDRTIKGLAAVAQQLGVEDQTVALFAPTPATAVPTPTSTPEPEESEGEPPTVTPTSTNTAVPTIAPSVTVAPTSTTQPNFRLLDQQQVCGETPSQIAVIALDALLNPEPGVEVIVSWASGKDRFFTGFKPDFGLGYGDFTMSAETSYTVFLAEGSPEISGLRIETCDDGTQAGWELTFQNLRFNPAEE